MTDVETPRPLSAAMVLGAGLGKRMRPLTDHVPKPMVALSGRPLIDHVLARLHEAGVSHVVVNVHYCADVLERHLRGRRQPQITISDERGDILDTGGGVAKALGLTASRAAAADAAEVVNLDAAPFWIHNSDSVWIERDGLSVLDHMAATWDGDKMDCLLMLARTDEAIGYDGAGDFELGVDGRLARRQPEQTAPYVFAGVSIMRPQMFHEAPKGAFSLNLLWNKAMESRRLFGFCANAIWMHVGDPASLDLAERQMRNGSTQRGTKSKDS